MAEKICPMMTVDSTLWFCLDGHPRYETDAPCEQECRLWENGDCGLKVARGDRYKEMWRAFRSMCIRDDLPAMLRAMDKIEAEMGKG